MDPFSRGSDSDSDPINTIIWAEMVRIRIQPARRKKQILNQAFHETGNPGQSCLGKQLLWSSLARAVQERTCPGAPWPEPSRKEAALELSGQSRRGKQLLWSSLARAVQERNCPGAPWPEPSKKEASLELPGQSRPGKNLLWSSMARAVEESSCSGALWPELSRK